MSDPKMVTTAVIISLVSGILIILDNLVTTEMIGMIRGWVGLPVFGDMASWIGLVAGFIVLIAAIMLRVRPGEATQGLRTCCIWWGSIILVFSIVSLFGAAMVAPWARYLASLAAHLHYQLV
jgi:hypothetical protein